MENIVGYNILLESLGKLYKITTILPFQCGKFP